MENGGAYERSGRTTEREGERERERDVKVRRRKRSEKSELQIPAGSSLLN